jgi:hypothetical protein
MPASSEPALFGVYRPENTQDEKPFHRERSKITTSRSELSAFQGE